MSHGELVDALIHLADDALYQPKAAGRDRVVLSERAGSPVVDAA